MIASQSRPLWHDASPFFSNTGASKAKSVVSGQQCAVLGGGLLVIAKIIGVAKLAAQHDLNPIYWVETNDSDWQEVNACAFHDKNQRLQLLRWHPKAMHGKNFSIGDAVVDASFISLIETFFKNIAQTKHTKALRETVLSCHRIGSTLGEATIALLKKLVAAHLPKNYLFFNPQDDNFLSFSRPFLMHEANLTTPGEQCPFFIKEKGVRLSVFKTKNGERFSTRRGDFIDLKNFILLPHLKTRSILQDAYFDAHYYVAGPSEKKYLEKLVPRYRHHGVVPAKIVERMRLHIVEKTDLLQWRALEKGIPQHQLPTSGQKPPNLLAIAASKGGQALEKHYLATSLGYDKKALSAALNEAKHSHLQQLAKFFTPTQIKILEKRLYHSHRHLLGQARRSAKDKFSTSLKKIATLSEKVYIPSDKTKKLHGGPQERIINMLEFFNLYGDNTVAEIARQYQFASEKTLAL